MVPQGTFLCIETKERHNFYPDNWRQFIINEASDLEKAMVLVERLVATWIAACGGLFPLAHLDTSEERACWWESTRAPQPRTVRLSSCLSAACQKGQEVVPNYP